MVEHLKNHSFIQLFAITAMVLGVATPIGAQTTKYSMFKTEISLNGSTFSTPDAFVANGTTYMPIYYVQQLLNKLGIQNTWDGSKTTQTWTFSTHDFASLSSLNIQGKTGSINMVVNGRTVERNVNRIVARDTASGQSTTFVPIWYIQQLLNALAVQNQWSGNPGVKTWTMTSTITSTNTTNVSGFVVFYDDGTSQNQWMKSATTFREVYLHTATIRPDASIDNITPTTATQIVQQGHLNASISVYNFGETDFDAQELQTILEQPQLEKTLINNLANLVKNTPYKGINIDFELCPASDAQRFVSFLSDLQTVLHQENKSLSVDVPAKTADDTWDGGYDYAGIAKYADEVLIMSYDYSYPGGPAGPIAPVGWVKDVLQYATHYIPLSKLQIGLPVFGYDWHGTTADGLTLGQVNTLISQYNIVPKWDPINDAPYFTYTDASRVQHTVYYESAQSITAKLQLTNQFHIPGVFTWYIGSEDANTRGAIEQASTQNQPSDSGNGLDVTQKRRADQLISLFENGTTDIQYGYAEQLHDGRGITCGRAGFTTGTGDAYEVVQRYTDRVPNNKLAKYLPELKRLLTATNTDDVSGLNGFSEAWSSLGNDPIFRSVQDQVSDELYYNPSVVHSNDLGLVLPLSRAEIYDAIIQHGDGDDPDGLQALINQTNKIMGGSPKQGIDEKKWLNEFLSVRENDLLHPADGSTQAAWAQSTGRIVVFRYLVKSGNYQLDGPIRIQTDDYDTTIQ